uniref:Putative TMD protein n=1 Tax=Aedes anphevirus TaxID=2230910 RepID=A0A2Z4HFH6_9MONO|nr:putative TMD protein [Aedes anphevirus]
MQPSKYTNISIYLEDYTYCAAPLSSL